MKIYTFICLCYAYSLLTSTACGQPAIKSDSSMEREIATRISEMSLEEKIGQMVQLEVNMITQYDNNYTTDRLSSLSREEMDRVIRKFSLQSKYNVKDMYGDNGELSVAGTYACYLLSQDIHYKIGFRLDPEKMINVFATYKTGSILNMLGGLYASTPGMWHQTISQIISASQRYTGIPAIYGLDQVHGTTYSRGGTIFPHHIGMAASFNPSLAQRMGEVCAYETRACGIPWVFCPNLDLGRKPAWSRQYEGLGEDSYLAAEMGKAYLTGLQGENPNRVDKYHVGTCLKHYFGYGIPDNGKDRTPANTNYQELRERYYEPFRKVINKGALSVMTNSSILNGMNGVANKEFLTSWLKDELQWDGVVVTDWGDIENLRVRDHICSTQKEAIKMAVNAGVDLMMVPSTLSYAPLLKELVKDGDVSMKRIDDAVSRVLRLKYRTGLFDTPLYKQSDYPLFGSKIHAKAALDLAIESEVLLKNGGNILPISVGSRLLVCGPNADTMRGLNGGWTYSWQGNQVEEFSDEYHTILEALKIKFGQQNVVYEPGVCYDEQGDWQLELSPTIDKAVAAAQEVDYIIACVGENSYAETTGNINETALSVNQQNLVKALQATGKPVILVLNEGRPRLVHDLVPDSKAIVDILLPGNYGGDALAELLAGDANFSGRLPFTYPSHANSFTTYDFKTCEMRETMPGIYNYDAHADVEWWFGEGLSYTNFEYSNLRVSKKDFCSTDTLKLSVDVKNTGSRRGKEVVMLFSSDLYASLTPDNRRLRAFKKIELAPGEMQTVTFAIPAIDLAFVNASQEWALEKGEFAITVKNLRLKLNCTVGETINKLEYNRRKRI